MLEKVIFRLDKERPIVFALFPEIPGDPTGSTCQAYCQEGAQFAAHVPEKMLSSLPAEYSTYRPLADMLVKMGFDLMIIRRETEHMREVRKASGSVE